MQKFRGKIVIFPKFELRTVLNSKLIKLAKINEKLKLFQKRVIIKRKVKVIHDSLKAASDCQKSYADLKQKDIEFQIGDRVFLKVSPWKKDITVWSKGKIEFTIHRTV